MYATHEAYFTEFVHMIPNERPTLVSLACNIELFQALFQCRVERAIISFKFFSYLGLQLGQLGRL